MHAYNPNTGKEEAGGLYQVPEIYSKWELGGGERERERMNINGEEGMYLNEP